MRDAPLGGLGVASFSCCATIGAARSEAELSTPRKRYFRVADSIYFETWEAETTHAVVRLLAFLNIRWQREGLSPEEACEVVIDGRTAVAISGARREHVALKRIFDLPRTAGIAGLTVDVILDDNQYAGLLAPSGDLDGVWEFARRALEALKRPTRLLLRWPKFSDFQSFTPRKRPPPTPTPTPTPTPSSEEVSVHLQEATIVDGAARAAPDAPAGQPELLIVEPDELPIRAVTAAFGAYGRKVQSWSKSRRRALQLRAREFGLDALATAVHGYVWLHRHPTGDFEPMQHFTPETIFRPSNFGKYLDAGREAEASGEKPPYTIKRHEVKPRFENDLERFNRELRERDAREALEVKGCETPTEDF